MDRRTALAAAGAAALTVTAGAAAIAANLDMLGAQDDRLGELQPVAPVGAETDLRPVEVETIVVDVPASSAQPVYDDAFEDEYDDSEYDDSEDDSEDDWYEREEDEEHEDEEHEYEGHDDDD